MFDNLKNLASVMSRAGEMREKVQQLQAELERRTVEADAGAGAVRVVANGKMEVISIRFDAPLLKSLVGEAGDADLQMVEDLVTSATNAALVKARQLVQEEITRLTGGLNIPGLDGLLNQ